MSYARIYWSIIKNKYATRLMYRGDFVFSLLAFFSFQILMPIFVSSLYMRGGSFPGWGLYEMLLLVGTFSMIRGFCFATVFGMLWNTMQKVRSGTFDFLMVRPIHTLIILFMDSFDEEDISQFIGGLTVVVIALANIGIHGSILLYALLLIVAFFMFFGFALIGSACSIRFINAWRIYEILDGFMSFANYPKTVYTRPVAMILSTVLPLMVASYYPASALLGTLSEDIMVPIISSVLFMLFCLYVWLRTLKYYSSAGG